MPFSCNLTGSPVEQNCRAASTNVLATGFANPKMLFAPIQFGELVGPMISCPIMGIRTHNSHNLPLKSPT
jgi:hypothetical protein